MTPLTAAMLAQQAPQAPAPEAAPLPGREVDRLVEFWSRQMSEHALFLSLGIVADTGLQSDAKDSRAAWESFRSSKAPAPERALALAAQLRALKESVLARLRQGEWLGWLFPSFVEHVLAELDHFVRSLKAAMGQAPADRGREIYAVLGFMKDHAAFAAHLLDPSEVRLIRDGRALVGAISGLVGVCRASFPSLMALSQQAARDLDKYLVGSGIGTPRTKSVVHPVLAAHVVREGRMFMETLKVLGEAK